VVCLLVVDFNIHTNIEQICNNTGEMKANSTNMKHRVELLKCELRGRSSWREKE
jgi:hypothetical protein